MVKGWGNNMSIERIDTMAGAGYDYAVSGGQTPIPEFEDDMDLMAFNAGIANAGISRGAVVPPITANSSAYIEGRGRASDKELAIIWGGK